MIYKRLKVTILMLMVVCLYLSSLYIIKINEIPRKRFPLKSNRHRLLLNTSDYQHGTRQTNKCTADLKRSRYILQTIQPGRTGNYLFQIYCLLSFSSRFCYTPVLDPNNIRFVRYFDPIFDLHHVLMNANINPSTFQNLSNLNSESSKQKLIDGGYNWAVYDRCAGFHLLLDQEQFVRSSVNIKKHITQDVDKYFRAYFTNRSTVAIHVRRTDRLAMDATKYAYADLEWYEPFIRRAMIYLKNKHLSLSFIFVSDDIKWCREHFKENDVYFSPFKNPGYDLALIGLCDHVILTIGTFGYHGAWLGNRTSVIYSNKYVPRIFYKRTFFHPYWTGL